jgi:hypothetical protein
MSFSDVCSVAPGEGGLYAVAHAAGVPMHGFLAALADRGCTQIELPPERAWRVIRFATSAALEEVLHCRGEATAALAHLADFPDVGTLSLSTR